MEADVAEDGLRRVFAKLAEPGYRITSNQPVESLLTHISKTTTDGVEIITLPSVSKWIIYAASEWNGALKETNKFIKTFILRLTALATEKMHLFEVFSQNNVYQNIFAACNLRQNDPSMKLGVLKIIHAMTNHRPGVEWLLENGQWEEVIRSCHQNQTIYFSRASINFITAFVWKLNDFNYEEKCNNVILEVLTPLLNNKWRDTNIIDDEENSIMSNALLPTMNILIAILDNIDHFGKSNMVIRAVTKHNLEWHVCNLFQLCRRSPLLGTISKLLLLTRFAKVYINKQDLNEFVKDDIIECCITHANIVSALIAKRDAESILGLINFCFLYVVKVKAHHNIAFEVKNEDSTFDFPSQIIIMSLLSMLCTYKVSRSDFVELYIEKLISMACEHTTRVAYGFRDLVKELNDLMVPVKAVQYTVGLKKYLTKSQAIIIFQSFYYKLQDFVPEVEDFNNYIVTGVDSWEANQLVSTLLDAIYIYIDEFDIPWQDTVEVLCVYNFCTRIIKTSNLESKLSIQAFKLAQLTIKKFKSPNLALLVNTAQGSIIEEIGKMIYEKLHDPCWDIRDSAMEFLYVVTDIAEFKFPAFQQQISENNLPELVITLAMEDSESYVRASALRCIAIMVRIQVLWEKHMQFSDLPSKMMNLLHLESEGLVRKEAAGVMVNIYEYQKFSASILDSVFLSMFHAAAEDLHWEVRLTALQFWKRVIANQMSHQGMIDGIFPSVTFSKENRKIVTLNEKEIKRRLKKILNELAVRGCLGVLLSCMKDESEVDVMEKTLEIIDELIQLLDKYNMTEIDSIDDKSATLSRPIFDENFLKNEAEIAKIGSYRNKADVRSETNNITLNGGQNVDTVIESIVNSDDLNLLANVYANQLKVDSSEDAKNIEAKMRNDIKNISNMFVEPDVFVRAARETNYKKIIEDKKKWIANISTDLKSLFDDILGSYAPSSDVNNMDCY